MDIRLHHIPFLVCLFWAVPMTCQGQYDTVRIGGYKFQFSHETVHGDYDVSWVGLTRLEPGPRKWLMKHKTQEMIGDCNSLTVELGDYRVSDTTITFYTAWTYDDNNMFPVGVRRQVYRVTEAGALVRMKAEIHLIHDVPPCVKDIEFYLDNESNPNHDRRLAWKLFFECFELEYRAHWVDGKQAIALYKEVRQVLGKRLEEAYRSEPTLQRL